MKRKITKILTIVLAITTALTCLNLIVPAENEIVEENTSIEQQDNSETPLANGMNRSDWNIQSETDSEIVLESYKGTSTDIIIPGEMDGKQVYINGATDDSNLDGRTEFLISMTSLTIQEVNEKKVKVKNNKLSNLFGNGVIDATRPNYESFIRFDGSGLDTTGVFDMYGMFSGCTSLTTLIGLENWDTSSVTDMWNMFYNCTNLTTLKGLETWNTTSLTRTYNMFAYCSSLKDITALTNWNVSSVGNDNYNGYSFGMSSMFYNCSSLTDLTPLKNWNVSSAKDMINVFYGCSSLTTLSGLENWNVSSATNMSNMFLGCTNLLDVTALSNWNVSSVISMESMFSECNHLTFANLSNWSLKDTCIITNMFRASIANTPLLVIGADNKLKNYNYEGSNRIPVGPTFDANGGKFSDHISIKKEYTTNILDNTTTAVDDFIQHALDTIEDPTKTDSEFLGWQTDTSNMATVYERMNATYTANWKEEPWFIVDFNSDGGSNIISQKVKEGQKARKPEKPLKSGYEFDNWYESIDAIVPYDFTTPITENKTLYAKYTEVPYLISYVMNDGTNTIDHTETYKITSPTMIIQEPSRAGYEFIGWTYVNGRNISMTPSKELTIPIGSIGDWVLFANWKELTDNYYTVTFDSLGGSIVDSQTIIEGGQVIEPEAPVKEGYTFTGWKEGKTRGNEYDFTTEVNENKTLYASWQEETYTIRYELHGGKNHPNNPNEYTINSSTIEIQEPSREGYLFTGWTYQHEDITTTTPSEELYIPTGSIKDWSFEANWKEAKEPVVSFNSDGGSEVKSQIVEKGTKAIRPVNPIKEGYIFEDWYESGSTDPYNFDTLIQEDKTLYARYKEEEYHIVYVLNGGNNHKSNPTTYTMVSTLDIQEPSREGYQFTGWSYVHGTDIVTKPNGTTLSIPSGSTGDWVLIANWEKEEAVGFMLYNSGIQLLNNGTERDDWQIASETDSEIVLKKYVGSSTDIIIPGEMDGKQVYITGVPSSFTGSWQQYDDYRTAVPSNVTSIQFQIVNGKKVKVKNNTLRYMFGQTCQSLISFDGSGLDTSGVTNMKSMFQYCLQLTSLTGLSTWDTSAVTNMQDMFWMTSNNNPGGLTNLKGLENWDVSSVTNMCEMFGGNRSLTDISALSNWNVSNVTEMRYMFQYCENLTSLKGLETWDVSSVMSMYGMFSSNSSLTDITALSSWNLSSVTEMSCMFSGCYSLSEVDALRNWDISSVIQMYAIFISCYDLRFIDLSNWDVEEGIINFEDLFDVSDRGTVPLLVICKDEKLKNYNYAGDGRIPVGPTFDTYGGSFSDGSTSKQPQTTYILENTTTAVDNFIDQAIEAVESPIREGYKFLEWQANLKEDASVYKRMSATYQATWIDEGKLIIRFDSQGGSKIGYQILDPEDKVSKPNDPVRENYTFQGWYLDKEGTIEYDFDTPVKEDLTLYAKWQETSYQINYVGVEDNDLPTSYTFSSPELMIQEPTKPGYTFTGWTYIHGRDINLTSNMEVIIPSGSTEDWVLFANWKENDAIKVTFDSDGGSKVESQDLLSGMSVERPEDPSKKGYSFDNWYEGDSNTPFDFTSKITTNITLKAKWNAISYDIDYDLNGGINDPSNPNSYTIEDGNIEIKEPIKEGYTFIGWTYDNGEIQTRKPSKELYIPSRSQKEWKLTAHYQKVEENYTVTFYDDGSKIEEQVVKEGKKAVETISPEKEGYVFEGWYEDGEGFDFDTVINEDKVLTAKYKEEVYHITYWKEEVTRATNQSTYTITSPEITLEQPVKEGYHFLGWSYVHGDKMNMTPSKTFSIPRGSIGDWVIFENWQEKEKYEVTFDSGIGSQVVEEGNKVERPSNPSKKGYTFVDWYEEGSNTPFDFHTILTKDTNLQARWNVISYDIYYELDGGINPVDNPNSYTIEDGDIEIKEPSKKGYTFMGWTCEHDGVETTTPSKEITIPTGSIEDWKFIAHYERNVYTVSFDTDGGSKVESQVVEEENKALRPIDPSKKGYTFIGWYEKGSDIPYDFDIPIIEDKELIAKYEEIMYQISYEMDEGINPVENPSSYTVTSPEIKLKEPTKEGYTFIGWTYEHGSIVVSKPSKEVVIPTGSIEDWKFTANFKEIVNSYTIRFESNGGSEVASQVVEEGSKAVKPSEPTRAGYVFVGWYEDEGCNKEYNFETIIDQDRVIYAKWQEEKVITSEPTRILPNMMMLAVSLIGILTIKKRKSF